MILLDFYALTEGITPLRRVGLQSGGPVPTSRGQVGLAVITWRLNGRKVPGKRSMRFVVARAAG